MPGLPSLCAARAMARVMRFDKVFWKLPRQTTSTANKRPIGDSSLELQLLQDDIFHVFQMLAHGRFRAGRVMAPDRAKDADVPQERLLQAAGDSQRPLPALAHQVHEHVQNL